MSLRLNWGHGIALVYVTFAAGTLTMVGIASSNHVELVSDDYYARSLRVDEQMAETERGRRSDIRIDVVPSKTGAILQIAWPADTTAEARGSLTLYRASMASADRTIPVQPRAGTLERVPLSGLAPGRWNLQVQWTSAGHGHYVARSVVSP